MPTYSLSNRATPSHKVTRKKLSPANQLSPDKTQSIRPALVQQALENPHPARPETLLQLQRLVGNQAVGQIIAASPTSTASNMAIQRKMNFRVTELAGEISKKAWLDNSTFNQINKLLIEYWKTNDIAKEIQSMEQMSTLANEWMRKRDAKIAAIKDPRVKHQETIKLANSNKYKSLSELLLAIQAEFPEAKRRQGYAHLAEKVGMARQFLDSLSPRALDLLVTIDRALAAKDVDTADDALVHLKASIGDMANLLKERLIRYHIGQINPELARIMSPTYKLEAKKDQALLNRAKTHIQHSVKSGLDELKAQGDEGAQRARVLEPSHSDLEGKAAQVKSSPSKNFKALEPAEIMALSGYTTDFYGKINTPLRKNAQNLDLNSMAWAKAGVSGLNKLKDYKGEVFRHIGLYPGYKQLNHPGAIVSDLAFSSSAVKQAACANAGEKHDVLEIILSKTGKEISETSVFGSGEAEVLFRPGTEFRVLARIDKDNSGNWAPNNPQLMHYLNNDIKEAKLQIVILKTEV